MKLVKAERMQLERIVAISKSAFETDVAVGGAVGDYPPKYDSLIWHEQMLNEGHLFQAIVDDVLIGGAILFLSENKESLYVGRIFVDSLYHKKGYGIAFQIHDTDFSLAGQTQILSGNIHDHGEPFPVSTVPEHQKTGVLSKKMLSYSTVGICQVGS